MSVLLLSVPLCDPHRTSILFISCAVSYVAKLFFKCILRLSCIILVFSMTGLVASFNLEVGITGAILTKLDGDSRGGAALSVKEVVNNCYAQ